MVLFKILQIGNRIIKENTGFTHRIYDLAGDHGLYSRL